MNIVRPRTGTSESAAIGRAEAFLRDNKISVDGLDVAGVLVDHESTNEYQVTWTRRVNGALVPDRRVVSVNPETGDIFGLVDLRRAYQSPPDARVASDEAEAIAMSIVGGHGRLRQSELVVTFDDSGAQGLVWQLGFVVGDPDGPVAGQAVAIDAMTGEVVQFGP